MTQLTTPTTPSPPTTSPPSSVHILILGAGWTSTFLIPLLTEKNITFAATTRNGHDHTISFTFDPTSTDTAQYSRLPNAKTVLITFPLKGAGQSKSLTALYATTHPSAASTVRWIQLGSTGIFTGPDWNDSTSAYDKSNARAIAEDELLALLGSRACVLNLAGLYGGERQPRNWVRRVAGTKEEVRGKGGLHLVHGRDVARGVFLAQGGWEGVAGRRWIVCDLRVYDWWELVLSWGREGREMGGEGGGEGLRYEKWVVELMGEEGVRALPRDGERLGRRLDGRGFWTAVGGWPESGRLS